MGNGYGGALAGIAGAGLIAFVLLLVVAVAVGLLGLWVVYTVIWRAVRRGLREYYSPSVKPASGRSVSAPPRSMPPQRGPRDW